MTAGGRWFAIAALGALLLIGGCGNDGDRGLLLMVTNRMDDAITIQYEAPGRERSLGRIGPGESLSENTMFRELQGCGGPFVARRDDGTAARAYQGLCPNVPYTIGRADLTPAPSSAREPANSVP